MGDVDKRVRATVQAVLPTADSQVITPGTFGGVKINYPPDVTLTQYKAVGEAVAAFDWSEEAQTAWDVGKSSTASITAMAFSTETGRVIDRIVARVLCTMINDLREKLVPPLPRILEDEFIGILIQATMAGAGAPATLPPA